MARISYSAVVLDEKSRSRLLEITSPSVTEGWEKFAHHMTINMGEISPEFEKYVGDEVKLRVVSIGISDMAIAVGVEGFPSKNKIPHVTIAVNRKDGGKPFMSNLIKNWKPIQFGFELTGTVTEIPW